MPRKGTSFLLSSGEGKISFTLKKSVEFYSKDELRPQVSASSHISHRAVTNNPTESADKNIMQHFSERYDVPSAENTTSLGLAALASTKRTKIPDDASLLNFDDNLATAKSHATKSPGEYEKYRSAFNSSCETPSPLYLGYTADLLQKSTDEPVFEFGETMQQNTTTTMTKNNPGELDTHDKLFLLPTLPSQQPHKSRYISSLLQSCKRRSLEKEIIEEKLMQKKLEKDTNDYKNKEVFVTPGYKRKLEERDKFAKELLVQEKLDRQKAVTTKQDLSDFYSELLRSGKATRSAFPGAIVSLKSEQQSANQQYPVVQKELLSESSQLESANGVYFAASVDNTNVVFSNEIQVQQSFTSSSEDVYPTESQNTTNKNASNFGNSYSYVNMKVDHVQHEAKSIQAASQDKNIATPLITDDFSSKNLLKLECSAEVSCEISSTFSEPFKGDLGPNSSHQKTVNAKNIEKIDCNRLIKIEASKKRFFERQRNAQLHNT